jgi:hypothetical protein
MDKRLDVIIPNTWQGRIQFTENIIRKGNRRENVERIDEKIAKEAVLRWCELSLPDFSIISVSQDIEIEENKPDYVFCFSSNGIVCKAIVEIRRSGSGFVFGEDGIINRYEDENLAFSLYQKLVWSIFTWADCTQTIILTFDVPIKCLNSKILRVLKEKLKQIFYQNIDTANIKIDVMGKIFMARSTSYYKAKNEYSPLKFSQIPSLAPFNQAQGYNIIGQAVSVLVHCIGNKEVKYQKVKTDKWLVILNTYQLLDYRSYQDAYNELKIHKMCPHTFEKVFTVIEGKAHFLV